MGLELGGMSSDRLRLPFQFLVTSAQGHLKKARFFRRSGIRDKELLFLHKFDALVSSSLPSHPCYAEKWQDGAVLELQSHLEEVRKQIQQLEVDPAWINTSASRTRRVSFKRGLKGEPENEVEQEEFLSTNRNSSQVSRMEGGLQTLSIALSPKRLQRSLRPAVHDGDSSYGQVKDFPGFKLKEEESGSGRSYGIEEEGQVEEYTGSGRGRVKVHEEQLAPGNVGDQVQEFRKALDTFGKLEAKGDESEYLIKRLNVESRSHGSNTDKLEDVDFIKQFIASGRSSLYDAQTKVRSPWSQTARRAVGTTRAQLFNSLDRTGLASGSKPLPQEQSKQRTLKKEPELADENIRADCPQRKDEKYGSSREEGITSSEADEKWQKLVKEQLDLSQRLSTLIAVTEKALGVMEQDIRRIEKDKDDMKQGQDNLRFENRSMRLELRSVQETGLLLKEEVEALKNAHNAKVNESHQLHFKLQAEVQHMKEQLERFKTVQESLKLDKQSIKEMSDLVMHNASVRKEELQALKKDQEEAYRRLLLEGEKEKASLMDRIKTLTQLYLRGLEDVRSEVLNLKALSESRVDTLMEEMKSRIEGVMQNVVDAAVKLQEKYTVELEKAKNGWDWAMNIQIEEARAILEDFTEQRQSASGGQNVLVCRIQRIEDDLSQLRTAAEAAAKPGSGNYDDVAGHQELVERDLQRLDGQLQDVKKKVDQTCDDQKAMNLAMEVDKLEDKMRELTKTWSAIQDKIIEMGKQVWNLEESQATLASSLKELRTEKHGLNPEVESRLEAAETSIRAQASTASSIADKVDSIEKQVGHVRAATISKLRYWFGLFSFGPSQVLSDRLLDSKLETYKVGVEQALTGASVAEKKCGVLGREIVKVFRMLAARNGKLGGSDLSKPVAVKDEVKEKKPAHSGCSCCSKTGWSNTATASLEKRRTTPSFIDAYAESCYASSQRKESGAGRVHGYSTKRTHIKLEPSKLVHIQT